MRSKIDDTLDWLTYKTRDQVICGVETIKPLVTGADGLARYNSQITYAELSFNKNGFHEVIRYCTECSTPACYSQQIVFWLYEGLWPHSSAGNIDIHEKDYQGKKYWVVRIKSHSSPFIINTKSICYDNGIVTGGRNSWAEATPIGYVEYFYETIELAERASKAFGFILEECGAHKEPW